MAGSMARFPGSFHRITATGLISFLVSGCCGAPWGSEADDAIRKVRPHFLLLAPASGHRMLMGWDDVSIEKVSYAAPWTLSISPDRQSVIYSKIRESPEALYLERKGREARILEAGIPWIKSDNSIPEVHWLRDDGGEALILANWKIYHGELSSQPEVAVVVDGVRSISAANGHLVYLPRGDRNTLVSCRLTEARCLEPRTFDTGVSAEQVAMAGSGDQALLLTFLPETVHYEEIALIDLRTGSIQALEFPPEMAWVVGVHPIPGTTTAILEEGGRTELIDGSTQIRFYLWDYAKNHTTLFYEDCRGRVLFRHRL
jgi:hypothetical protein